MFVMLVLAVCSFSTVVASELAYARTHVQINSCNHLLICILYLVLLSVCCCVYRMLGCIQEEGGEGGVPKLLPFPNSSLSVCHFSTS